MEIGRTRTTSTPGTRGTPGATTTPRPRRAHAGLAALATLALTVGASLLPGAGAIPSITGPGTPAGAAPPAVAHSGLVNPDPIDNTPHIGQGRTEAVLDLGSRVIVGGTFSSVTKHDQPQQPVARRYLFAYDK